MAEKSTSRHISSIPGPLRRYFAEHPDTRRRVTATVSFFHGTGSHFHVELVEEPDYVWDPDRREWIAPTGDTAGEGRRRFMKFRREDTARRWIQQVFDQEFSEETHRLEFTGDVSQTWFYPEGD
ncbi:MAG: hypothetical protein ACOCYC_04830 [bacterium]